MKRKHYHVLVGLRGLYMPDTNYVCRSKRAAIALARYEAKQWNESEFCEGHEPGPNQPAGFSVYCDGSCGDRMKQDGPGRYVSKHFVIEVAECTEDCKEDE